ncbi:MAG TPA: hypothetical protein ENI23_06740 [bacterium]|nr:hypothetical protein [bacterium]
MLSWILFALEAVKLLLGWGKQREENRIQETIKKNKELKAEIAGKKVDKIYDEEEARINEKWNQAKTVKDKFGAIGDRYRNKRKRRKLLDKGDNT